MTLPNDSLPKPGLRKGQSSLPNNPLPKPGLRKGQSPLPLIEKYRVKSFSEIKGQDLAINEVETFLKTFPKKEP